MALSLDLRKRIHQAHQNEPELTQQNLADRFMVNQATVSRLLKRSEKDPTLSPIPNPGRPRKLTAADEAFLSTQLEGKADLTLKEQQHLLQQERGKTVCQQTILNTLTRMKWSRKKRASTTPPETQKKRDGSDKNSSRL